MFYHIFSNNVLSYFFKQCFIIFLNHVLSYFSAILEDISLHSVHRTYKAHGYNSVLYHDFLNKLNSYQLKC